MSSSTNLNQPFHDYESTATAKLFLMTLSVSERCRSCIVNLQQAVSLLSRPARINERVKHTQVNEELERFVLFVGNIGALHDPESSMSIESRLQEANEVFIHFSTLLDDLKEASTELLHIVSGRKKGMVGKENNEEISEVVELYKELSGTINRLFRIAFLIRQAALSDPFAKALSRNRYHISDQYDIAHVGERHPKLATDSNAWLRQRLGRAITQRRCYLRYIQDHRGRLCNPTHDHADAASDSINTKATTFDPGRITSEMLVLEDLDTGDDLRSSTTMTRSVGSGHEASSTAKIPNLADLPTYNGGDIECTFCFQIRRFKNERTWRRHVFADLRSYVCTYKDCDAPYFGDIDEWFQHEMTVHRVIYRCFLCPNTTCNQEDQFLSHLQRNHGEHNLYGKEQQAIEFARRPLTQIPASDCPCCLDWPARLRKRMVHLSGSAANNSVFISPKVFKQHVGGHLEQLALFAAPSAIAKIGTEDDSDAPVKEETKDDSDAPVKAETGQRTGTPPLSHLEPAMSSGTLDQTPEDIKAKYHWVCCSCQGENSCNVNAGCSYCQNHWRNTCCYTYVARTIAAIESQEDSDIAVKEETSERIKTPTLLPLGPATSLDNLDQTSRNDYEEYRWVCCSCQGDNSCDINAGCAYCQSHWRNTCCYVYVYKKK
jgi:hypothetical protein